MNYPESAQILEEIRKSKKILVNCHKSPDADSIGSALSMYQLIKSFGKEAKVICPDKVPYNMDFLPLVKIIDTINFSKFDFSPYDLFIILDSSSRERVTGDKNITIPGVPSVVIDHHNGNDLGADIKLVDTEISATAELVYRIFEDWETKITESIATTLLTGIVGDTGAFRYPNTSVTTIEIAAKLMRLGANKNQIVFNCYQRHSIEVLRFWGELLNRLQVDKSGKFVWLALNNKELKKHKIPKEAKSEAAGMFLQGVEGTDFGIIIIEKGHNITSVSLRSRLNVDVSKIASELGGGGHSDAAGAEISDLPFEKAVEKILDTARRHAK